jgi:hypothetical protein
LQLFYGVEVVCIHQVFNVSGLVVKWKEIINLKRVAFVSDEVSVYCGFYYPFLFFIKITPENHYPITKIGEAFNTSKLFTGGD